MTDDEYETDTVSITYPRTGSTKAKRQVDQPPRVLRSALKNSSANASAQPEPEVSIYHELSDDESRSSSEEEMPTKLSMWVMCCGI